MHYMYTCTHMIESLKIQIKTHAGNELHDQIHLEHPEYLCLIMRRELATQAN